MSTLSDVLFFVLSALSILFALATVFTSHILRSATYLMGVLCLSAGFYILLGAELLAGIQMLVYVGGIVVLLVIAVMLTQNERLGQDQPIRSRRLLALLASSGFFAGSNYLLSQSSFAAAPSLSPPSELAVSTSASAIKGIGLAFLDASAKGYLLPFELISLLLLTVLVAGIVVARKEAS